MTPELRSALVEFARQVTPATLDRLADEIVHEVSGDRATAVAVGARFPDPHVRHGVVQLLAAWFTAAPGSVAVLAE
ncbi:MAG: hypothetical protein IT348_01200, partial [Candidatus Eisenbacteria bacterium]|nr:hypothetical protein [Candidatus Eisenbacteria bacterium]